MPGLEPASVLSYCSAHTSVCSTSYQPSLPSHLTKVVTEWYCLSVNSSSANVNPLQELEGSLLFVSSLSDRQLIGWELLSYPKTLVDYQPVPLII